MLLIQRRPVNPHHHLPDSLHPVSKRVLAARQISSERELDYSTRNLLPYNTMLNIDKAAILLNQALAKRARIVVVADFDADGATSCALAIKVLRQMGAHYVNFVVPNREKHAYGLTPEVVDIALAHKPDLLITVDNGIVAYSGVEMAKYYGMQVLITDHHTPGEHLPVADVIVNPNQHGDSFASKSLAGVGVIFYVMLALRAHLRAQNWFSQRGIPEPNLADVLDLVALGTVADVVPLDYNNRILVDQGLKRIRANRCCPGIRALLQVAKREPNQLAASDLAFGLAPRLNAAGRMDDMSYGIACLLSETENDALEHAESLNNFNDERRFVEAEMQQEANAILDDMLLDENTLPVGLCLLGEHWHSGVIGIIAGRMKERLHRPVIVFAQSGENIKGSARSVPGVHIRDVLANIDAQYPEMIKQFGGHAMAAGLTLPRQQFQTFQQVFDNAIRRHLSSHQLQGVILSDGELTPQEFTLELAEQLRMLTPFGQGFQEPIFDGEFEVVESHTIKDKHLKMLVRPTAGSTLLDAIAFNQANLHNHLKRVQLVYKLDVNVYRGAKSLQLLVEHIIIQ